MSAPASERIETTSLLLPRPRHPYYIVSPRYVRTSAGIKVLHLFCHALNRMGYNAYMIIQPPHAPEYAVHPDLLTPLLTPALAGRHLAAGRTPIVVYPETIAGNPLSAPVVLRYVMNFPGLLGGSGKFDPGEYVICYSRTLAAQVPGTRRILCVPASDPDFFSPDGKRPRRGACFYAGKYKDYHHGQTFPITDGLVEITRDKPDSQTPEQIRELFRTCERFYCYENTALEIEAVLCHCPAICLPNEHFTAQIGQEEFGTAGFAWGIDPSEVSRAVATVEQGRENYLRLFAEAEHAFEVIASETQSLARQTRYENLVHLPATPVVSSLERAAWLAEKIRYHLHHSGFRWTARLAWRKILRGF